MNETTDKENIRSSTYECSCCSEIFKTKEAQICPFCGCTHLVKPSAEAFEKFYGDFFTGK